MNLYNLPNDILLNIKIPIFKNIGNIFIIKKIFKIEIKIIFNNFIDNNLKLEIYYYFKNLNIFNCKNNFYFYFFNLIKKKNNIFEINIPNDILLFNNILYLLDNILLNNNINIYGEDIILTKYYPYNFKKLSKLFI